MESQKRKLNKCLMKKHKRISYIPLTTFRIKTITGFPIYYAKHQTPGKDNIITL